MTVKFLTLALKANCPSMTDPTLILTVYRHTTDYQRQHLLNAECAQCNNADLYYCQRKFSGSKPCILYGPNL
jgi:hypothetical protein